MCLFSASDVWIPGARLQLAACRGMFIQWLATFTSLGRLGERKAIRQDAQRRHRISDRLTCAPVQLLKKFGDQVHVDIIDRLPTPFGLVRSGVAPDHQDTKVAFTDVCAMLAFGLTVMHILLLEQT